jgi:TolB-like protein/Flp pilus assembly protein TadD
VGALTETGNAVFLSYASQDADAAQHLCEALRNAGVEVWFDQSELRGGDTWDASIRRQIKNCGLFVPMISANTQSREEGYFRREWNLAVARTLDMAGGRAFLLPVVIDGTSDSDALVPEKFRDVQWTRLPAGANTDDFVEHVRRLMESATIAPTPAIPRSRHKPAASPSASPATLSEPARSSPPANRSVLSWAVIALLTLGIGYLVVDKFVLSKHAAPAALAPTAAPTRDETAIDKSVAVLPFADMSEKRDQEYFSDGLAEELIDQLGKIPGLKVIARTSSFTFKGKSDDIATIAAKLKVANILEGSVRRAGNQLRVSTQLIHAESGQQIWSETYNREFKDVFTIQDEIAGAVVSALKLQLTKGAAAPREHGTANTEAYNAFLLGRQIYAQGTTASFRQSIESFQKAITLDPHYADAYASLALSEYAVSDAVGDLMLDKSARQHAQQAIDLDPKLANAYAARGLLRGNHFDWVGMESDIKRALALEPTNNHALAAYATFLSYVGRQEEAAETDRKAIEQDPLAGPNWARLGLVLVGSGKRAEAYDAYQHAQAISPNAPNVNFNLASLQLLDGKAPEALGTLQGNTDDDWRNAGVAMAQHTLGDSKASQQALEKLIATGAGDAAYQIADVYAWRGEKDNAFEWLERAYRQQDGGLASIKSDPLIASLRSDPRYMAMLRKLNFPP